MFTVTLQQLEMRDSGWYWCGAGQQQVAVHVSVTAQTTTRTSHRDHSSTTNYILTYSVETCVVFTDANKEKPIETGCCWHILSHFISDLLHK